MLNTEYMYARFTLQKHDGKYNSHIYACLNDSAYKSDMLREPKPKNISNMGINKPVASFVLNNLITFCVVNVLPGDHYWHT